MDHTTPRLTIGEALAVLDYTQSLSWHDYRILAEWLGCYKYVLPADRILVESVFSIHPIHHIPYAILAQYNFTILLENHYTETEQHNIVRHILCYLKTRSPLTIRKARTPMLPYPKDMLTQDY